MAGDERRRFLDRERPLFLGLFFLKSPAPAIGIDRRPCFLRDRGRWPVGLRRGSSGLNGRSRPEDQESSVPAREEEEEEGKEKEKKEKKKKKKKGRERISAGCVTVTDPPGRSLSIVQLKGKEKKRKRKGKEKKRKIII